MKRSYSQFFGEPLNSDSSVSPQEFSYYETRSHGGAVENWKRRIREGSSATSVLSAQRVKFTVQSGNVFSTSNFNLLEGEEWFQGYFVTGGAQMAGVIATPMQGPSFYQSQVDYNRALNLAISSALGKIQQAQTSFQGGVFLGELGETIRMISSPMKAFQRQVRAYLTRVKELKRKARGLNTAKRSLKANNRAKRRIISDAWLEYSYGWKPLVSDIDDGFETLSDLADGPIDAGYQRFRGGGKDEWADDTGSKSETDWLTTVRWRCRRTEKVDVRIYGALSNKVLADVGVMHKLGLGMSDFVPTIWELIPYSFLVDYFSNAGEVLSSLSTNTSSVAWVNIGTKFSTVEETYDTGVDVIPSSERYSNQGGGNPGSFRWEASAVTRMPYIGDWIPSLVFEKPAAGSLKWLNIAALLSQHQSLVPF
jgi:hypothetical protein